MSWRVSQDVWRLKLPYAEKIVLLAFAEYADDDGICWPGIETVAKLAGCHKRTCQRKLDELTARGFISVTHEAYTHHTTRTYRIEAKEGDNVPPYEDKVRNEAKEGDSLSVGDNVPPSPKPKRVTESHQEGDNVPPEYVSEPVSTTSSLGNGQSEFLTDPPTPTRQAVAHFLQTFGLKWNLTGSTLRSWCHALDSDPKYASLDIPRLVLECEEHHDGNGRKKGLEPTKRIKYWLNGAAPGGRFAKPEPEAPRHDGHYR